MRRDRCVRAVFLAADLRRADQASALITAVSRSFGQDRRPGQQRRGLAPGRADTASPRLFESIVALNLLAPLYCAQAANAVMQGQAEGGSIVNITSVSGIRPSPGTAAYGAAKAGLINLTQTLAMEWAPKVRVNSLCAGMVATEAADDHYGGPEGVAAVAATVPLGRLGTPGDVAAACLFLASPLAAYVTGANLVAHGGGERPPFLAVVEEVLGGSPAREAVGTSGGATGRRPVRCPSPEGQPRASAGRTNAQVGASVGRCLLL